MASKRTKKPIGVIGAGVFGTTVANLLAKNTDVILYGRDPEMVKNIQETGKSKGITLQKNIEVTNDLGYVPDACEIIFPVIPSSAFRDLMKGLSEHLHPYHILIHGTKGLDVTLKEGETIETLKDLTRHQVKTMSEVVREESVVIRVGCLAGPNIAGELSEGQPGATVVASYFNEVIHFGQQYLKNERFQVYGNSDLIGIELAGVLKNIIAIAAGALSGLGYGENAKGLLISRGLIEIIYLGNALGGDIKAFLGLAGIGDLITTCNSTQSRNFTVGYRLAKGETIDQIKDSMEETAEGINTVKIMVKLAEHYGVKAPITQTVYNVMYKGMTVAEGLQYLMNYPMHTDIKLRDLN
ncbi:MAG: NAD(P)-dependent glycerol-3-phosphate dehydrogenase [Cyclobacteriaceae bacterium]|nr:NAD(P)-dependent glycerol-3-phosphate dehydrogenase [Cyclobacteriaceae bacterium]